MLLKKIKFITLWILLGVSFMSYSDNSDFIIRTSVDMKYAFCDVKTNGVSGTNNRSSVLFGGIGFGSTSTNSMLLMENGDNTLTIELAALNWFAEENLTPEARQQFHPNARCEIVVNRFDDQGNITPLAQLTVKINQQGQPEAYDEKGNIDTAVEKKVILARNTQSVNSDKIRKRVRENEYPKGMTVFQFNKKIMLDNLPNWPWIKAEKYQDTPQQRALLQAAYQELWLAFDKQDIKTIKRLYTPALENWVISTGGTVDSQFKSRDINHKLEKNHFQMIPINWDNFEPLIMNNGKMVKLIYKEDFNYSPISYRFIANDGDNRVGTQAPIFSFVDGKFIPVI